MSKTSTVTSPPREGSRGDRLDSGHFVCNNRSQRPFLNQAADRKINRNRFYVYSFLLADTPVSYIMTKTKCGWKSVLKLSISRSISSGLFWVSNRRAAECHKTWSITIEFSGLHDVAIDHSRVSSWSRSGVLRTQKWKSHLLRAQSSKVLLLKPGAGQNIAMHATPTARDFFLANFYPFGPFTCIFFSPKLLLISFCRGCGEHRFLCRPAG